MNHKPLFPPGIHDISESDLENHFLSGFPSSSTRQRLISGLKKYLKLLKSIGVKFEIWIDGSFTTEKEDPGDIDLVVFGSTTELNHLPSPKKSQLHALFDRVSIKNAIGCDVLFAVAEDQDMRSYWRGWYGFDRNENPKGIARIEVGP